MTIGHLYKFFLFLLAFPLLLVLFGLTQGDNVNAGHLFLLIFIFMLFLRFSFRIVQANKKTARSG